MRRRRSPGGQARAEDRDRRADHRHARCPGYGGAPPGFRAGRLAWLRDFPAPFAFYTVESFGVSVDLRRGPCYSVPSNWSELPVAPGVNWAAKLLNRSQHGNSSVVGVRRAGDLNGHLRCTRHRLVRMTDPRGRPGMKPRVWLPVLAALGISIVGAACSGKPRPQVHCQIRRTTPPPTQPRRRNPRRIRWSR